METGHYFSAKKLLGIGLIIILLQYPIGVIKDLVYQRENTKNQALERSQDFIMLEPLLKVYYQKEILVPINACANQSCTEAEQAAANQEQKRKTAETRETKLQAPEFSKINTELQGDKIHRGIFPLTQFQGAVKLEGRVALPKSNSGKKLESLIFSLMFRGNPEFMTAAVLKVKADSQDCEGKVESNFLSNEISVLDGVVSCPSVDLDKISFLDYEVAFDVVAYKKFQLGMLSKQSSLSMKSNWHNPGFEGLAPVKRDIGSEGFAANWNTTKKRNYQLNNLYNFNEWSQLDFVTVNFLTGIDIYKLMHRLVHYQLFIFLLIFLSLAIYETARQLPVHIISYVQIGAGLCLFYFIVFSFSEHLSFNWAYLSGSLVSAGMITGYLAAVLKGLNRAALIGGLQLGIYGVIYIILQLEMYALIAGTIALTLLLALTMYSTRNIDWYGLDKKV